MCCPHQNLLERTREALQEVLNQLEGSVDLITIGFAIEAARGALEAIEKSPDTACPLPVRED